MLRLSLLASAPLAALLLALPACAPRQTFVQVPTFAVENVRLANLEFAGFVPTSATLTLRLRVQNPNPFGLSLAGAGGSFFLEGQNVGEVRLPNVNLPPGGEALQEANVTLPVSFANAATFLRVARGEAVSYRVDGTFTVDAGFLGRPTFGPYTLAQGVLRQPRIVP